MEGCNIMFARIRRWVETTFSRRQKKLLADVLNRLNAAQRELQACRTDNQLLRERLAEATAHIARLEKALGRGEEPDDPEPPDREPPDDPEPPRGEPWTFAFESKTLEEAKEAARARIQLEPSGSRTYKEGWEGWKDLTGGTYTEMDTVRAIMSTYGQKAYSNLNKNLEAPNDTTFKNVSMGELPEHSILKWFVRMGNIKKLTAEDVHVRGRVMNRPYWGNPDDVRDRTWPLEHAFYCETTEGCLFQNCLFETLGGHGTYIAYRPRPFQQYGPQNGEFYQKPLYVLRNVSLVDTEQDAMRGSHSITFFDTGNEEFPGTVLVEDTCVVNGWDFERLQGNNVRHTPSDNKDRVRSCGPMVVHNYEEFSENSWPTEKVTINRSVFWQVKAKHSMGDLRNAREFVLKDSFFRAQDHMQPILNVGSKKGDGRFRGPEKVTIQNCKSDGVTLRIWTGPESHEDLSLSTEGKIVTWTPNGIETADL